IKPDIFVRVVGVDGDKPYIPECFPTCVQATACIKDVWGYFIGANNLILACHRSHQNDNRVGDVDSWLEEAAAYCGRISRLDLKIHGIAIVELGIVRVPQMDLFDQGRSLQVDRHILTELRHLRAEPITGHARATLILVNFADVAVGNVLAVVLSLVVPASALVDARLAEGKVNLRLRWSRIG